MLRKMVELEIGRLEDEEFKCASKLATECILKGRAYHGVKTTLSRAIEIIGKGCEMIMK